MKQLNFEIFVLKFMLWLIFRAIFCCKISFSNGKSNFKMGFNLLNNKSRKQFVYSIFSDKMRFREFCRLPILLMTLISYFEMLRIYFDSSGLGLHDFGSSLVNVRGGDIFDRPSLRKKYTESYRKRQIHLFKSLVSDRNCIA
jgi:hypothetical protein